MIGIGGESEEEAELEFELLWVLDFRTITLSANN